jgi:raffinose/stachyose/melibiose transport system permease protein
MALIAVISLFPFIWALISSFKTNQQILSSAFSMPTAIDFTGYAVAIKIANIPNRFMNSVIISSVSTAVAVILFAMSSYAFARFNFKGRGALFGLLICSLLIPTNAMIQPVFATIKFAGLYDTRTALVLVYIAFRMPMCLFILRSYFLGLPREIEEAAYVEGAGFFNTFVRIVLPMSKPALASAAVLSFIDSWNELLYAMMLTSREAIRTLPLAMKHFVSQFSFNYTAMFAAMVMCMLPTVVMYILLQEQIMESMVAGSLKG